MGGCNECVKKEMMSMAGERMMSRHEDDNLTCGDERGGSRE